MKRFFVLGLPILVISMAAPALAKATAENKAPAAEAIMQRSGCFSCHRIDHKFIGPPFVAVARRYARDRRSIIVPRLVEKVRRGGAGDWGEIPMVSHPTLTKAQVTRMVDWVLSLKGKTIPAAAESAKADRYKLPDQEASRSVSP